MQGPKRDGPLPSIGDDRVWGRRDRHRGELRPVARFADDAVTSSAPADYSTASRNLRVSGSRVLPNTSSGVPSSKMMPSCKKHNQLTTSPPKPISLVTTIILIFISLP